MAQDNANRTRTLIISSMLTALVFVVTFLLPIPVSSKGAYINLGDSIIYCAGMLVGAPWAAAASGIGSALSDWALGYTFYAPASLIIKGLMGFVCATLIKKGGYKRFLVSSIIGGAIMVAGYGLFEVLFMGGWGYAATTVISNLIQWAAGVIGATVLYYPVKRVRGLI